MTTSSESAPYQRPAWVWLRALDGAALRGDQITAARFVFDDDNANLDPETTYLIEVELAGRDRSVPVASTSLDDAPRTVEELLQVLGEQLSVGHPGVVAWGGKQDGFGFTAWTLP